jgi:hypothetical protein
VQRLNTELPTATISITCASSTRYVSTRLGTSRRSLSSSSRSQVTSGWRCSFHSPGHDDVAW